MTLLEGRQGPRERRPTFWCSIRGRSHSQNGALSHFPVGAFLFPLPFSISAVSALLYRTVRYRFFPYLPPNQSHPRCTAETGGEGGVTICITVPVLAQFPIFAIVPSTSPQPRRPSHRTTKSCSGIARVPHCAARYATDPRYCLWRFPWLPTIVRDTPGAGRLGYLRS
jgi:hypothetical protein